MKSLNYPLQCSLWLHCGKWFCVLDFSIVKITCINTDSMCLQLLFAPVMTWFLFYMKQPIVCNSTVAADCSLNNTFHKNRMRAAWFSPPIQLLRMRKVLRRRKLQQPDSLVSLRDSTEQRSPKTPSSPSSFPPISLSPDFLPSVYIAPGLPPPLDSSSSALCSPDHWIVHNKQGAQDVCESSRVCSLCTQHIDY